MALPYKRRSCSLRPTLPTPLPTFSLFMSPLTALPTEVLERIALEVALDPALGPPVHLIPFLCTCRHIHTTLVHSHSKDLYAKIFRGKFDVGAVRRRIGISAVRPRFLASQLKSYCITLKRIRRGDINAPDIEDLFRTIFILLTENDGKNREQLEWANTYEFVNNFVQQRLWEDTVNGWPKDTPLHSLALWVLWCMTDASAFLHTTPPSFPFSWWMILQADLHAKLRTSGITSSSSFSLMLSCPSRFAPFFSSSVSFDITPYSTLLSLLQIITSFSHFRMNGTSKISFR